MAHFDNTFLLWSFCRVFTDEDKYEIKQILISSFSETSPQVWNFISSVIDVQDFLIFLQEIAPYKHLSCHLWL